ncbi:hypothetical protein ACFLUQ_00040 [Chloroflexota bacterium]
MVDIVQVDPYQCLIRKIGYSVGLEHLLERVVRLVELYAEQRGLSLAAFRDLVENEFRRKNATEHFADVYGTLRLVKFVGTKEQSSTKLKSAQVLRGELLPLHNLETLSILRRYFKGNNTFFLTATKTVLTQAILEADGDVFLNGLASDFESNSFRPMLINMIKKKRELIRNVIKSPGALKKVYSIIDIKTQPSQKGRGSQETEEEATSKFAVRKEPLDVVKRTTSLSDGINEEVEVPDDYLRKVPATRKSWAEDLDLFENGHKNAKGIHLLEVLDKSLRVKQETGSYVLWPYSNDLAKLQIKPKDIEAPDMSPWVLLCAIAQGVRNNEMEAFDETRDYSEVIAQLKEFHRLYREGSTTYSSIRHQLPLYVAEPCIVAVSSANAQGIPPLPAIIEAETRRPFRRINRIVISGTEGGIVFSEER